MSKRELEKLQHEHTSTVWHDGFGQNERTLVIRSRQATFVRTDDDDSI